MDGTTWGPPVAKGTGTGTGTSTSVTFKPARARFVRISPDRHRRRRAAVVGAAAAPLRVTRFDSVAVAHTDRNDVPHRSGLDP